MLGAEGSERLERGNAAGPTLWLGGLVLAVLGGLIAVSPRVLVYDERYYMQSSHFLAEYGDLVRLMRTPLDLAAGPLYACLHVALAPLTDLELPAVRFVNFACLLLTLWACARVIARLGHKQPWPRAAMLLAVPMIGPTSGMALTELPALALASLAVLGVAEGLAATEARKSWAWWTLAGLAAGGAILGRQTYLPGLLGFAAIGWRHREQALRAAAATTLALLCVAPLVVLWRGLTPPDNAALAASLAPQHAILAFIYLAVASALIAPRFFAAAASLAKRSPVGVGMAFAALAAAAAIVLLDFPIGARVVAAAPAGWQDPLQAALRLTMAGIAALFVLAAAGNAFERRGDPVFALVAGLTIVLTGTAAGIGHQFSSRYVLVAFPFALLMLQPWIRPGTWAAARIGLGAALGLASLAAYYWNAPPTDPNFRLSAPPEVIARMPLDEIESGGR
ncbi:MAG: hypothetical protein LC648_05085 [Novosphingobium sp.]|nr:hypothetical protein [Novosphingobium sp.]